MKSYSPLEKPVSSQDEVTEKPAPYNWLLLLIIFIGYIMLAVLA